MKKQFVAGVLLPVSIAANGWAVGGAAIGNEVPSARAAGQGYVGVAGQSDDPAAVYSNPAALTKLENLTASAGFTWENLHGSYESDAGDKVSMRSIDAVVPNLAVTKSFMDGKLGAGLALQSPYGLETHWPDDSALRYLATNSTLRLIDVTPAVAYKATSQFSVGAGIDYFNLTDANLEKNVNVNNINAEIAMQNSLPVLPNAADADSKLKGTSANWGYHAGVLYEPTEHHAIGVTYHSKVKLNINGSLALTGLSGYTAAAFGGSSYSTSAFTDIYLPQNIQFGYAFKPTDRLMLEFDASWVDWFANRDENVRYSETDPARLAILTNGGNGDPIPLTWRDTWNMATGANYKVNDRLQVRGGFWYLPHAAPETTFNPSLLDLSRYGVSVGCGYAFTSTISMDFAYNAVFFHSRHITNTIGTAQTGDPTTNPDGTFKNFVNLIALNVNYKFGRS